MSDSEPRTKSSAKGPLTGVAALLAALCCGEEGPTMCRGLTAVESAGQTAYVAERVVAEGAAAERLVAEGAVAERLVAEGAVVERLVAEEARATIGLRAAGASATSDLEAGTSTWRGDILRAERETDAAEAMAIRTYGEVSRGLVLDPSGAHQLAGEVIRDIARHRPDVVLAKLERLSRAGKQLSPEAREALRVALQDDSAAVAAHVEHVLETGNPLQSSTAFVSVDRGHLVLTRDIADLPKIPLRAPPTDLGKVVVYIDDRLLVGREGLQLDTGDAVARWSQLHRVRLIELERDTVGALPDRFVEGARTATRVTSEPSRSAVDLLQAPRVIVMLRCEHHHDSAKDGDAC